MRYREDDRGIMTNRERVTYDRWLTTPPDEYGHYDAVCEHCGEPCDYDPEMCLCEECLVESGLKVRTEERYWYCESCGDEYELDIDPGDEKSEFCPKCRERGLTDHAAIGELVVRLLSAGDLRIWRKFYESGGWGYEVWYTSEEAKVDLWDERLVDALERVDENVSLLSCS